MVSLHKKIIRYTFRIVVVSYLVFLLVKPLYAKKHEPAVAEYGIGGGVLYEETVSGSNADLSSDSWDEKHETESLIKSHVLFYDSHTIKSGDNISVLAVNLGLNQDTIISINKITNSRLLQIGKVLKIPNQDGILHTVKEGETLKSIADKYEADVKVIQTVNELFSENIAAGKDLFIPGARLDRVSLQEINGDLFIWPVSGAITSPYGYRRDPFNNSRSQFHTGMDIRGSMGTPIKAAMAGRVSQVGYDNVLGNYVIISHHSGYRTLYGHMSVIRARTGAYVTQGEIIGEVGNTGLSTGPHLHFTVYKNGVTVNPRVLMR